MFDLIFVFERIEFEIGVTSRLKNSFILRTFNDSSIKMKIFSISNTPGRKKINYTILFGLKKHANARDFSFHVGSWPGIYDFSVSSRSQRNFVAHSVSRKYLNICHRKLLCIYGWYALYKTFWNINVAKRRVTLISTLIKYETNLKMHIEVARYFW